MKVKKSGIITILCAICSWISQAVAFQFPWKRQVQRTTTSFVRSLSGILTASTSVLSQASGIRGNSYLSMVATAGRGGKKEIPSVWMLPAWLPMNFLHPNDKSEKSYNQSPLRSTPNLEPFLEEIRSASRSSSGDDSHNKLVKSVQIAGYMDYDPKIAARNAYKTGHKSGMKRDTSWFNM